MFSAILHKINLQKCVFRSKEVSYLGFCLTKEGIKPGIDKLKAMKKAPLPFNVHEVRQFLGLCNFLGTTFAILHNSHCCCQL
jgi:hypothetical protein